MSGYRAPTPEALALKQALEKRGVRILAEIDDGYKHIDLAIPAARLNIEVDGRQHYENPHQIISDLKRTHYSDDLGYDTIHIPNTFIHDDLEKIADALAEATRIRSK
jgi:very-short-patch-repair endonuclease